MDGLVFPTLSVKRRQVRLQPEVVLDGDYRVRAAGSLYAVVRDTSFFASSPTLFHREVRLTGDTETDRQAVQKALDGVAEDFERSLLIAQSKKELLRSARIS